MKKCIILLLFLTFFVFAEEEATEIFEMYKDSIVYVQQTLYFESSKVKHPEHFRKLEDHYKMKLLDTYFTIASGSGFFISTEGHILTNHHVIDISGLEDYRKEMLWGFLNTISRELPDDMFTWREFEQVIDDFEFLFTKSEFHFRLTVRNEEQYTFKIVKYDKKLDIAVIKIPDDEGFTAIPLGDSDSLKVGKSVIALGYPLQIVFDLYLKFKELKSSLTTGAISALRDDIKGIQHTATINFGNSGGPLINLAGEVIGVNVVKVGSTIFFAIPSKKILEWLEDTHQDDLIALNESTSTRYASGTTSTIAGKKNVLDTGKSLFIKLEKPYDVYINDVLKGTTPLLINDLESGDWFLRIESDEEYHGIQLKVIAERTDIVTYTPEMGKYVGNLFVESTPEGAKVYIDGKIMGETPAALSDITVEKHTLRLTMKGYQDYEEEIIVRKKDTIRISRELIKVYQITFLNPLPGDTKIKVYNDKNEYMFSEEEEIWLVAGSWTFVLTNKRFKEASLNYEIAGDKKISFTPEYYRSRIRFENLRPESTILLAHIDITGELQDNTYEKRSGNHVIQIIKNKHKDYYDITGELQDNTYETRVGDYEIRIKTDKYLDYCEKVELEKDKEALVQIIYEVSPAIAGKRNAWIGYPVLGTGVVLLTTGLVLNNESVVQYWANSYDDYVRIKWTGFVAAWTGIAGVTVGTIFAIISIKQFKKAKTDTEIWKNVALSVDIRNNVPVLLFHIPLKE